MYPRKRVGRGYSVIFKSNTIFSAINIMCVENMYTFIKATISGITQVLCMIMYLFMKCDSPIPSILEICTASVFSINGRRLTRSRWMPVSREFELKQRPPLFPLSKKLCTHCLVLVGSRNGFERDLHKQTLLVSKSN